MEPKISLQTLRGTFNGEEGELQDTILTPELVESLGEQEGASVLAFGIQTEGEIPEEGLEVTVNSDVALTDYFSNLGRLPFTLGGEIIEAVYNESTGEATGFRLRVDSPNALVSFTLEDKEEIETEGVEEATFTLEAGEGYSVAEGSASSTISFYDSLETAPTPEGGPTVSLSVDENNLVETEGNTATFTFNVDGEIPEDGLLVYVNSPDNFGALGEFDVFNAEITGGGVPFGNFAASGFYFNVLENGASITVPAFDETTNPEIEEGIVEGIQDLTFELVESPGYTIAEDADAVTVTIADDADSQLQVSYTVEPTDLVESETTVGVHTFNLSTAPPEDGLTVSVSATRLEDFNLDAVEVMGGEITEVGEDGFQFKITDMEASISLPILDDADEEFLEEAEFTLDAGEGYQIDPEANGGTFTLVNTSEQVPLATEEVSEPNDTIELAQSVGLGDVYSEVSIAGAIEYVNSNRYELTDEETLFIDGSEDVDFYQVDLAVGDTISLDADANQFEDGRKVDPWLRLFDASGTEVASNDDGAAPNEIFDSGFEPYIEYTANEAGSYYVGVSIYNNGEYDPLTPGSGTGNAEPLEPNEYGTGEYTLNLNLNQPDAFIPEATEIPASTGEGIPISLFTVAGVYNDDFENGNFDILGTNLAETVPESTGSALNFVLTTEEEVPEEGIEVYVDSDIALNEYFGDTDEDYSVDYADGNLGGKPFSRGGEFLEAVYDENGDPTGFKFLLEESYATIALVNINREEAETDGAETATFSLVESEGYTVTPFDRSTVTFYDTLEDIPAPEVTPEVSLELSTNELIESEGTELTLDLSLSEAPPESGVQVYVSSGEFGFLGELDVFAADIQGGVVIPDADTTGFYLKMFEETASITVPVFDSADVEEPEGVEQYDLAVVPGVGYTVNESQNGGTITIKDTPDSLPQVALTVEPEVLIESEATVGNINLSLSAPPPSGGITVTVTAPEILEFDLESLEVTGGEIVVPPVASDLFGFTINLTEQDATVSLAVADDGEAEALEEVIFTVEEPSLEPTYQVSTEAQSGTFTIADTPELASSSIEEVNDTIDTAIATGIGEINPTVSFSGEINQYFAEDEEGNELTVDFSEDVDLYSFNLSAGDTIAVDVDSIEYEIEGIEEPQRLDSELRLFNAVGEELQLVTGAPAPDEVFTAERDPYLEYTAEEDGTYYVGVAQLGNRIYDSNEAGTGSGRIFPDFGINIGEYDIEFQLTADDMTSRPDSSPIFGTTEADTIEVTDNNRVVFAGESDDLIDTSVGGENNRIYGGDGDDVVISGSNNRIFGQEGDDRFFMTSGGDNTVTGGEGADQFWIADAEIPKAANIITDFMSGEDVIGIAGLGIGYSDLNITDTDAGILVSTDSTDLALFTNTTLDAIASEDNFTFA